MPAFGWTGDRCLLLDFDITGKPMRGWVMVAEKGYKNDKDLKDWLEKSKKFAKTLPAK